MFLAAGEEGAGFFGDGSGSAQVGGVGAGVGYLLRRRRRLAGGV